VASQDARIAAEKMAQAEADAKALRKELMKKPLTIRRMLLTMEDE